VSGHYLEPLFAPRSVALVGATERDDKVAGRVLRNLLAAGYAGALYAVNPKYDQVQGVPCVASVDRLPCSVDLAVIATPAATVPGIVERCGTRGIPAAVVISAGFSEAGPEGARLEREMLANARRHGVRLLGPNCIGIMRPPLALDATFGRGAARPGALALIAQSGAVCSVMVDWAAAHGVGFSSVVSLGGSADVDFGEAVDYFASDPQTGHILLYIEGVRDGRRLVGSLRAAARVKPVILMKVGRHPAGSRAAVSHTGAIVGKDDVFDAVVRRTGAVRVRTLADLLAAADALAAHVRPSGERLAVITNGGGPGVVAADRAADLGIELATLAPATVESLQAALPPNWSHGNPVDLIGDAGPERYRAAVEACLADPGVDGLVVILTPQAMTRPEDAAVAVAEAARGASKPLLAAWMGEGSVAAGRERLRQAGVPEFRGPERAVETFAQLAQFYRNQRALLEAPGPLAHREEPDLAAARALVQAALAAGRTSLPEREAKMLLAAFRIPVNRSIQAAGVEDAVRAAREVGFPVALKIDSPDIVHKSDVGGVRLQLADEAALRSAHAEMMRGVATRRPGARIAGVTVEAMVSRPHGRELMAGIVRDAVFGPALAFGAGGIAVEVLRDRVVALPPLNAALAADMVRGTRIAAMLGEFRNLPAVDRAALDAVLLRVSEMACELPEVEELDINPLVADERGVVAVDARVVLRAVPAQRVPYAHLAIAPYPRELERRLALAGGDEVTLRPIRPEDAAMEEEFVAGLSEESRHMRFLSSLRSLTPAMLARFTQIDYDREMALVAVREEGGRERELAVCRYATLADGRSCEFAIVVADAWQRRGLGRRMMAALIEIARARGLEEMVGLVHAANTPMLRLTEGLGFVREPQQGDPGTRRMALALGAPLSGTPGPARASA
jgi:acetyltransferase